MTHELKINYPPKFEVRYGHGKPVAKHIEAIFTHRLEFQLEFIETIASYTANYFNIPLESTDVLLPQWINGWFPPLDAMSLYTMLASRKPNRYIEIGSGNSTKFARRAIQDHLLPTQITSIDPQPRAEIDEISNTIIRYPLEEVDLSVFSEITENDIVFFDGSHRCFQNSDVTVFFIDIIPLLPSGVTIGIRDIFWPS
ncbi:MAG TPA: class I SAM-dependent methyltransferase, partial [Candidatus Obscuribacterales bacterium]